MFGKTMSIPDELMANWFELCTDVPLDEARRLVEDAATGDLNPRDVKMRLAREIVALYHGDEEAAKAETYFVETFSKRAQPVEAPEAAIPAESVREGAVSIAHLVATLGLAKSVGEAKRLMQAGAVSLDGEKLADPTVTLPVGDVAGKVLRVGKHHFRRLHS